MELAHERTPLELLVTEASEKTAIKIMNSVSDYCNNYFSSVEKAIDVKDRLEKGYVLFLQDSINEAAMNSTEEMA